VLSVCSLLRHEQSKSRADQSLNDRSDLDLHKSEAPIEISSLNIDLTIDELGLTEYAVNGVLDIYVVERRISARNGDVESGKDAIFVKGSAWVTQHFPIAVYCFGTLKLIALNRSILFHNLCEDWLCCSLHSEYSPIESEQRRWSIQLKMR
jgi:hypothetical protein